MTASTPIPAGFLRALEEVHGIHAARVIAEADRDAILRASRDWQPAAISPLEWGGPVRPTSIRVQCFGEVPYPPARSNPPRAGEKRYEPGRDADDDRWERVGGWLAFALFLALCLAAGWAARR